MGDLWKTCWFLAVWTAVVLALCATRAGAVVASAPAILQLYEAQWITIEDRMADIFMAGYGQMWLPPPQRADSGNQSVGYDVFDRFDLGKPRNETLYGTETSLKANIAAAQRAGMSVYTDFVPNHNGFRDQTTTGFVNQGGYPGFVLTLPGDIDGDFHGRFAGGDIQGRLAGLIDIAQEKNHRYFRHPTAPHPDNIPAGTVHNKPDPNNARFYTDQALGGTTLTDPKLNATFTRYNFNTADPLAGDPVMENAMGLLMRNAQWMVEVIGVDGFRIDAAKHFERWVLDNLDQAVFRANPRLNLDGSIKPVFMFSEVFDGNKGFQQQFIRKDLPNPHAIAQNNTTVGGNRDVLDFPLFFALRDNLSSNGLANNWHHIRGASMDTNDRGPGEPNEVWASNGSQGVAFVQSHDDFGPHLSNVAHAYTLLRPGNAIVYMNAKEFGNNRSFPKDGRGDALGGVYGDAITTLVNIRNTHGRGDFKERWLDNAFTANGFSNIYVYERSNSMLVGLNSRLDGGFDQRNGVQTDFAPGTVLVELTGNAVNPTVSGGNIPEALRVDANGRVNIRIPRNASHGNGYVVFGVAAPQGELSIAGVSQVLPGATPSAANNGTARLTDIDVITSDSFSVRLETTPVTLPAPMGETSPVRDFHADGDNALFKINAGMDFNSNPGVDFATPGSTHYGFEQFTDIRTPGYISDGAGGNLGTGFGLYEQTIDATQLPDGRHYITVRAFRHRPASGTPVFTDLRRVIYVDRLPAESEVAAFEPFASNPGNPNNRDLIIRSVDQTADSVHVFLDLPPNMTDAQVLQMVSGSNQAGYYDRDAFIRGYFSVATGNHVATVVTYRPTGSYNIQRFPGLFTQTNIGAGFGDMNSSGTVTPNNLRGIGNNSFEDVLYSQGNKFSAQCDLTGTGLCDNRDLFLLGPHLIASGASQAALDAYSEVLLRRGDVNASGTTDAGDVAALYDNFGSSSWLMDISADGIVDIEDVKTIVTEVFRTVPGDFNLDGKVDAADYVTWRKNYGRTGAMYIHGDATFSGTVGDDDLEIWRANFGFVRQPLLAGSSTALAAVPEPATSWLWMLGIAWFAAATRRTRRGTSPVIEH